MCERDGQEELEIFIPPVKEFYFDPEKKIFIIEGENNKEEQRLKDTQSIYELSTLGGDFGKKADPQGHLLGLSPFGSIIEFSQLREWVASLSQEEVVQVSNKVLRTIEQVYKSVNTNSLVKLPRNMRGGVFGFYANLKSDGSFELSTFGNCACLGKNIDPHIVYSEIYPDFTNTSLPIEYELHNADSPAQMISLYAGAGTLAWLKRKTTIGV